MQRPRSRRVGDDKVRRQKAFLPDFRDAIKAARGPREGDRAPADALASRRGPNGRLPPARGLLFHEAR